MNVVHAGFLLVLALAAFAASAAERGVYTVVDGDARVLRKTTWYRLEPGARAEEGDVLDLGERQQVQVEFARGGTLSLVGPTLAYVAEASASAKSAVPIAVTLMRGWCKAANAAKSPPLTLDLQGASLRLADGIVVVHADPARTEFFVESGGVKLVTPAPRGKETARDARENEYWHRIADRAFESDDRPSSAFVASMPAALRDRLPSLASRFEGPAPTLAAGREVTFVEAAPWLSGPTRRVFARRFAPRLSDHDFRAAAAAHPVPEWDRTLHPEKYRPREDGTPATPGPAVTASPVR